jgi:hypothetical protein
MFQFGATDTGFEILSVTHKTKPEVDFGSITEVENTHNSRKVKYALLNPGGGTYTYQARCRNPGLRTRGGPQAGPARAYPRRIQARR